MSDLELENSRNTTRIDPDRKIESDDQIVESFFELADILNQQNDFQEILRIISLRASILFNVEIVSIMMINPGTHHTVKTVMKEGKKINQRRLQLVETNVIGWVSKHKQLFISNDLKKDKRFRKNIFKDTEVRSLMCYPLRSEGVNIGYIIMYNKNKNKDFETKETYLLKKFASLIAPFLSNVSEIKEYFRAKLPEDTLLIKYKSIGLIGKCKSFVELLQSIEAASRCDVRVLIEGQSGTGKELVARAIHTFSARANFPFIAVDCGAIPEHLIESELFGYTKGAFTGASKDKKGLIEEANHGTLFMDEIANLPYNKQAKLLRVLQEGEIRAVGSNNPRKVDVRIIAASSKMLHDLVAKQQFREDLYYRLHVYPIQLPKLEDRQEDIPLLANYFLKNFATQQHKQVESFHGTIIKFMQQKKWSGNIRELENFVERLITLVPSDKQILDHKYLPPEFQKEFKKRIVSQESRSIRKSLQENLAEHEEMLIRQTLIEHDWNQSKSARSLKITEGALRFKMKKLGILKPYSTN